MKKTRLLFLLVLLMTAATGAWANWTGGTYTATTNEFLGSITVSDNATLTINQNVTVRTGAITINEGKTLTVVGPGSLVVRGADGSDGQDGGVGINGSGCIVVKGNANVRVDGGDGGEGDTGSNGGNGGAAITCSVTIYSGTLIIYGGGGGDGQNGGNGGDCFAGSGTLTYYGGNVTTNYGSGGDPIDLGGGDWGNFGNAFASTYNVVFENQPTSLLDGYSDPITVENIKSANDVIIEGGGADPVPVYYTVSFAENTQDADKWTVKVGDATEYQKLPLEGVAEGAALTLKYDGTKKVKSVKAVKKAEAPSLVIEDKNNYFGIGNQKFYFTEGETWTEAMANHPENAAAGWVIYNDRLRFKPEVYGYAIFILRSGDYYIIEDTILNQPIDTSKTYMFEGTNPT